MLPVSSGGVKTHVFMKVSYPSEDELAMAMLSTRHHMHHARAEYNPGDFQVDPAMMNPWADPTGSDKEGLSYLLGSGSVYGSPPPGTLPSRLPTCATPV